MFESRDATPWYQSADADFDAARAEWERQGEPPDEPTPLQRAWPVGTPVIWLHVLNHGYQWERPIPATVLATNSYAGTVKIAAQLRTSGTKERWVRPERLRIREGDAQ